MKYRICKWVLAIALMVGSVNCYAQGITFSFGSDYSLPLAKGTLESNITNLLNALQRAGNGQSTPVLIGVSMEERARTRLLALWDNCPFVCEETTNTFPALEDADGYQVRGIPVIMKPQDNLYTGGLDRELVISFNKSGVITGVSLAMNEVNASRIMGKGQSVRDFSERRMILKFVEDLRCYYNEKDTAALRDIYSDDAIVITGSVVTRRPLADVSSDKVEIRYNKQDKETYLNNLKKCFKANKYIHVDFDKIEVVEVSGHKGYYGVTLKQKWNSTGYNDEGWLFLLWDFTKPEGPMIHVRTWQPNSVNEYQVFTPDDFRIN